MIKQANARSLILQIADFLRFAEQLFANLDFTQCWEYSCKFLQILGKFWSGICRTIPGEPNRTSLFGSRTQSNLIERYRNHFINQTVRFN